MNESLFGNIIGDILDINKDLVDTITIYTPSISSISIPSSIDILDGIYDAYDWVYRSIPKIYTDPYIYYIRQTDIYMAQTKKIYDSMRQNIILKRDIEIDLYWKDEIYKDGRGPISQSIERDVRLTSIIYNIYDRYFSEEDTDIDVYLQIKRNDIMISLDRIVVRHLD